jgi:small subunit ribosomal protein S33
MSVPRERLLALMKAQCVLFSQVYNPKNLRLGNKVLRQRLKGVPLASYYPRKTPGVWDLNKLFGHHLYAWDEDVESHLEHLEGRKERGKGQPRKKTKPPPTEGKKKKK